MIKQRWGQVKGEVLIQVLSANTTPILLSRGDKFYFTFTITYKSEKLKKKLAIEREQY